MNKFYTYIHTRTDDNSIFYVGKGCGKRAHSKQRNIYWKRIVAKAGGFNVEIIDDNITEDDAFDLEELIISELRASGMKLANLTNGGGGVSGRVLSEESRRKMSEAAKGRVVSKETRRKISEANTGKKHGPRSEETILRMSEAQKGKKHSDCHNRKIAEAGKGKRASEETRRKMSASHTGKKFNKEHRAKMSEVRTGKRLSEKHRKAISDGVKRKLANKGMQSTNSSGVTGVSWMKNNNKWVAYVTHNKKRVHLGLYESLEEAKEIRELVVQELGYHKNHGKTQAQRLLTT